MTDYARNRRETKHVEQPSDEEFSIEDLGDLLLTASSRKSEERAYGARKIYEVIEEATSIPDEHINALLDLCRGCLDTARPAEERERLVRIAAIVLLWGSAPEGFAADFGEALGKALPAEIVREDASASLVKALCHALTLAQVLEGYDLKASENVRLGEFLLQNLPGPEVDRQICLEYARCVAATADHPEEMVAVGDCILELLERYKTDLTALIHLVRTTAIAAEHHGEDFGVTAADIAPLEEASNKLEGGKDARKELAHVVRTVVAYMEQGETPQFTLTMRFPFGSNEAMDTNVAGFVQLNVLDTIRDLAGKRYQQQLVFSDVIKFLFDVHDPYAEATTAERSARKRGEEREERYNRLVAGKQRKLGRDAARRRKTTS